MRHFSKLQRQSIVLLMVLSVAACGGGGGSDSSSSTDTSGGSSSGGTTTQPTNNAPVANAGSDQTIVLGETATFNGSASSDADGDNLTYTWTISNSPNGSSAQLASSNQVQTNFVADVAGSYQLTLAVSDGTDSAQDIVMLTVTEPAVSNNAPVANAGNDQTVALGETATLSASASTDADGDNLSYSWTISSRPNGSSAQLTSANQVQTTFTADVAGSYQFTVSVSDGTDSTEDVVLLTVTESAATNNTPVANAGSDQQVEFGSTVTVDASASTDADGDSLSYTWAISSSPNGSSVALANAQQVSVSFNPDLAGTYVLTVSVSDGTDSSSDGVSITVNEQAVSENNTPVANAGVDQAVNFGETVTLDASSSSDADGDTLSYSWSIVSAPDNSTATFTNATAVSTTIVPDMSGLYIFRVTVSDASSSDGDNMRVEVNAATSNLDHFIINTSSTTDFITDSNGNPVLEDVQTAEFVTQNSVDYMYVEATGIPKYDVVMTQEMIDELNSRPKANDDFPSGSTIAKAGQQVTFGQDIGYNSSNLNCNDTGGNGYWPPGPACPTDQEKQNYFPTEPQENSGECETGLGAVGLMVNGTSIYNWGDGMSYGNNVWYQLAPIAEQYDVDVCGGHATASGDYHHHFYTSCLADLLGDDGKGHSPLYGFAADGYPVYGPYEADGTLAVSGWVARDYGASETEGGCNTPGERTCTLVDQYDLSKGVESAEQGPDIGQAVTSASGNPFTADDGFYYEDYYYAGATATGAQLDQHNGHDNNDGRGYHYHITLEMVNGDLTPSFPFTVGPNYKGELPSNTFARCEGTGGGGGGPGAGSRDNAGK